MRNDLDETLTYFLSKVKHSCSSPWGSGHSCKISSHGVLFGTHVTKKLCSHDVQFSTHGTITINFRGVLSHCILEFFENVIQSWEFHHNDSDFLPQQQTAKLLDVESLRTDAAMSVNKTMTQIETFIRSRFSRAEDIVKYFSDNDMLPDNNTWQIQENDLTELGLSS